MKKYVVRDREAGNVIDSFATYAEAVRTIEEYEKQDKIDGTYEENFYEIVEEIEEEC